MGKTLDWGSGAYDALVKCGVRQIPYVPDAGLSNLLNLCKQDNGMIPTLLSSEEEGIALAAGAWLGGERSAVLMQSSGVGNCMNALSLIHSCRFPLLMIITMRGEWREFNPWQLPMGQNTGDYLRRSGCIVHRLSNLDDSIEIVAGSAALAYETMSPVAVLVSQKLIGVKHFMKENAFD